jgi:hypothetical protein
MNNSKLKSLPITREQWLNQAVSAMTPLFVEAAYTVPPVRVSCGWPSSRGMSRKKPCIGECWDKSAATDNVAQIFISPRLKDAATPQGVLATLVHEIVHAVVGNKEKHNKVFGKCARAIGLEGKLTATIAGEALGVKLKAVAEELGDYPHAQLNPSGRPSAKQTTRLVKCECGCGYNVRVTRKWLQDVGAPLCPCNSEPMQFEIPEELGGDE